MKLGLLPLLACPDCGSSHAIFGHGGARETAEKLGTPFLGEIPLVPRIRETSDSGQPVSVSATTFMTVTTPSGSVTITASPIE